MTLSKQFEKNKQTNQWLAIFLKYFEASSEYLSTYLPVDNNTLNIHLLISKQVFCISVASKKVPKILRKLISICEYTNIIASLYYYYNNNNNNNNNNNYYYYYHYYYFSSEIIEILKAFVTTTIIIIVLTVKIGSVIFKCFFYIH